MKKQINSSTRAHFLRRGLLIQLVGALFFALLAAASNLPKDIVSPASLQPGVAMHETRIQMEEVFQELVAFGKPNGITPLIETVSTPPLRTSIMVTWSNVSGAKGYLLDVSTSASFSNYVAGYHDLDVGNVNGRAVTGLNRGTTYYYRVRPYTAAGLGGYSNVTTAKTEAATGLIINPHYDGVPQAMQDMIEGNIIPLYESLFSDPITIDILFRFSDTPPSPEASPSPFPPGVLAASLSTIYTVPWNDFISALRADPRTSNDNMAIASLPAHPLSTNIAPSSANGRAVGLTTPHALFADGTFGQGGPYDGIITLNSVQPFWFSRPLISGSFDAQLAVEHEMDEIMGLGSYLNRTAPPCLSYEAESPICPQPQECSVVAGGAVIQSCPNCSDGADVGFVGNNSGTLEFRNVFANASGRLDVKIWYANGDATRYAFLSVNGGPGTSLTFPSTGSFQTVGSIETTINFLNPGSNNTLKFSNPIVGQWAPDFDRIEVTCTIPPPASIRPQDLFSWSSPDVRNLTSDGTRYFSIDSGSTNIVNFNQTPPGEFGDRFRELCPQHHPRVQNAFVCPDQIADISATSPEGINLDVIGYDLGTATMPYLANLSTRTFVQTSDNVMIGGFIVQGTQPKRVIVRAIRPELSQHGVPNAMADPTLELHDGNGAVIASNDNWQHTIIGGIIRQGQVQSMQNSGHAPADANECAIIANLPPGNYTAIVRGVSNTTGVALVEVYDLH